MSQHGIVNTTPKITPGLRPAWQPGQSGNPFGRPKGSRNRLNEDFIRALQEDFQEFGKAAIIEVRTERPHEYLKVVASILPKQVEIKEGTFDGFSDEQLTAILHAAGAAIGLIQGGAGGTETENSPQQAGSLQTIP